MMPIKMWNRKAAKIAMVYNIILDQSGLYAVIWNTEQKTWVTELMEYVEPYSGQGDGRHD